MFQWEIVAIKSNKLFFLVGKGKEIVKLSIENILEALWIDWYHLDWAIKGSTK